MRHSRINIGTEQKNSTSSYSFFLSLFFLFWSLYFVFFACCCLFDAVQWSTLLLLLPAILASSLIYCFAISSIFGILCGARWQRAIDSTIYREEHENRRERRMTMTSAARICSGLQSVSASASTTCLWSCLASRTHFQLYMYTNERLCSMMERETMAQPAMAHPRMMKSNPKCIRTFIVQWATSNVPRNIVMYQFFSFFGAQCSMFAAQKWTKTRKKYATQQHHRIRCVCEYIANSARSAIGKLNPVRAKIFENHPANIRSAS